MSSSNAWGQHLLLDAAGCGAALKDGEAIRRFTKELVEAIGMSAYGEPVIAHFGHLDPQASGYTMVQLIETSHISAHFCDNTGEIYLDVFSCKAFDHETVLDLFDAYFNPTLKNYQIVNRRAPLLPQSAKPVTVERAA